MVVSRVVCVVVRGRRGREVLQDAVLWLASREEDSVVVVGCWH